MNRNILSLSRKAGGLAGRALLVAMFAWAVTQNAPAALTHRYSFTNDVTDSVGGANGTVMGNVTFANGAAVFPGASTADYIELPPGLISNYTTVTFEFWANVGANGTWEEIYGFGDRTAGGAGANMVMFTPHSGSTDYRMSYAQGSPGYSDEYVVTGTPILDNTGPCCIACVYDPPNNRMTLYKNGVQVGTLSPVTTGALQFSLANVYNVYSWLGRSLYGADAPYNGTIDEFRIFDAPLTASQVFFDYAAGPDRVVGDPGALQSLAVVATNMSAATTQPAQLVANFANATNLTVTSLSSNWVSSNPSIISADPSTGLLTAGASSGSAVISAMFGGMTGTGTVSVTAVVTNLTLTVPSSIVIGSARRLSVSAQYSDGSTNDLTASCSYTSGDSNVLTVISTPTGPKLAGWTNGTALVTATFQAKQASQNVTVVSMAMTHRWSFDDDPYLPDLVTPNTNLVDSVGGATGALWGGSFLVGNGTIGLDGTSGFVELPRNLFTNYGSVTFETWVTDLGMANHNWQRIYDFGNSVNGPGQQGGGTQYMFLSLPSGGGVLRGAYTITGGGAGEQVVQMNGRPAVGLPAHIVWTTAGASQVGRLYVDGVLVGTNIAMTLTPEDIGPTSNDWLGKAQFNDPYFYGAYDEFRVYNGALDPFSIAVDTAAGPTVVTNDPGALVSVSLTVTSPMNEGDVQQVLFAGQYANLVNPVPLTTLPEVQYSSSNTRVATINALGVVTAIGPGTTTLTASVFGKTATTSLTVNAVPTTLTHHYDFNDAVNSITLHDSVAGSEGQIYGAVVFDGSQATFDGTNSYILLPQDMFIDYNSISFEVWFTDAGSGTWARLVDIGNNNSHYMFLDAVGPGGNMRAAFNAGAGEGTSVVTYGARPAINNQHHVVFTQDALSHTAKLYLDGNLVAQNFNFTIRPRDIGTTTQSYLGRSQYNDPYYNGKMNDLRIWRGAISAQQVAVDYATGPNVVVTSPGAIQSVTISATNMVGGYIQQAQALANFAGAPNVNVTTLATNWVSSNPSVVKVSSTGVITAVGIGTATVSATYGATGSTPVTVSAGVGPVLAHRYSFTADATDTIAGANGTPSGNATFTGGRLVLDGTTNTFVTLPGGLWGVASEITLETWFTYPTTNAADSRLWDFGDYSKTNYLGAVVNNDTRLRYNFGTSAGGSSLLMPGATGASYNTNTVHSVWVVSPILGSVKLYVDGLWKETWPWTAPLSAISNNMAFLGHAVTTNSVFGNFTGTIDEFRIWNGALDQLQIQSSFAAGPGNPLIDPGTAQSIALVLNDPTMVVGTKQRPKVTATFETVANLNLTAYPGVVFSSSNPSIVAVTGDDQLQAIATGTADVTASYGGKSATLPITVIGKQLTLMHRYSFTADARDSIGKADGAMYGQAVILDGALALNGSRNPQTFVQLPRDIISGYDAMTIETWANIGSAGGTWERLWDFGNHIGTTGRDYIYFSPASGDGGNPAYLGLSANSAVIGEVRAVCAGLRGRYVHLACVVDSIAGTTAVYTNAVLAGTYTGPSPVALTTLNYVYNFLGRSQFNDNWFVGAIDEMRIYYGAMSAAQVAASYASGTNPERLSAAPAAGNTVVLSWIDSPFTAGMAPQSTAVLGQGANWQAVPGTPTLTGGVWSLPVQVTGQAAFFRLAR